MHNEAAINQIAAEHKAELDALKSKYNSISQLHSNYKENLNLRAPALFIGGIALLYIIVFLLRNSGTSISIKYYLEIEDLLRYGSIPVAVGFTGLIFWGSGFLIRTLRDMGVRSRNFIVQTLRFLLLPVEALFSSANIGSLLICTVGAVVWLCAMSPDLVKGGVITIIEYSAFASVFVSIVAIVGALNLCSVTYRLGDEKTTLEKEIKELEKRMKKQIHKNG